MSSESTSQWMPLPQVSFAFACHSVVHVSNKMLGMTRPKIWQLLQTVRKGSIGQLQFKGDPIDRPPTSREWAWLMRRLVALSKWANHKLGLDQPPVDGEIAETQTKVPLSQYFPHSLELTLSSLVKTCALTCASLCPYLCKPVPYLCKPVSALVQTCALTCANLCHTR